MCASSCAALRKNLRTWPESLAGRAISDPASAFDASSAQLLAQQGFAPSPKVQGSRCNESMG